MVDKSMILEETKRHLQFGFYPTIRQCQLLWEIAAGKPLKTSPKRCKACEGSGTVNEEANIVPCGDCRGQGHVGS